MMKKWSGIIAGILLSLIGVVYLISQVDSRKLFAVELDWKPERTPEFLTIFIIEYILLSVRWKILIPTLSFWTALRSILTGYGGNMVLPARGGDALRLLIIKRSREAGFSTGFMAILTEKSMDMTGLILAFIVSTSWRLENPLAIISIPIVVLLALFIFLWIFNFHRPFLIGFLERVSSRVRSHKIQLFLRKGIARIHEVETHLNPLRFALVLFISLLIWLVLYPAFYWTAFRIAGVDPGFFDSILILAFATMGTSLPTAPSAIGVYHAAVVTALGLLGIGPDMGLVLATWMHLMVLVPIVSVAILIHIPGWLPGRAKAN